MYTGIASSSSCSVPHQFTACRLIGLPPAKNWSSFKVTRGGGMPRGGGTASTRPRTSNPQYDAHMDAFIAHFAPFCTQALIVPHAFLSSWHCILFERMLNETCVGYSKVSSQHILNHFRQTQWYSGCHIAAYIQFINHK
jgi:hypothetical protein